MVKERVGELRYSPQLVRSRDLRASFPSHVTWSRAHVGGRQESRDPLYSPLLLLATRHLDNLHLQYVSTRADHLNLIMLLLLLVFTISGAEGAACGGQYPARCKCELDSHEKVRSVNCTDAALSQFPDIDVSVRTL